jgi:hypothetical protein
MKAKVRTNKLVMLMIISLFLSLVQLESCDLFSPVVKYSGFHNSNNIDKYKSGINGLIEILLGDYDSGTKWEASNELRRFVFNEYFDGRTIMLNEAVPGLLQALDETDEGVHINIIYIFMEIKPDIKTVGPAYKHVILNDTIDQPICAAMNAVSQYGEEAIEYLPIIAGKIYDDEPIICCFAIDCLGKFGKSAAAYLDKLEQIAAKDHYPFVRESAKTAIEKIKKDLADNG